jgi:cytochrome oxidase assembly protein ShyY1
LSAMSGMFGVGNAAEEKDGKFIVNDHGVERVVTKAEAMKGNRLELRLTRFIFGAFSALGLVVSLARRDEPGSNG